MKTEIIFYFVRNGEYTAWVAVTDPAEGVAFEVGDDCFEGNASDIPAWCEENMYDCVIHTENKPRFIDWGGNRVYTSEQECIEYKEREQAADDYGGDWK